MLWYTILSGLQQSLLRATRALQTWRWLDGMCCMVLHMSGCPNVLWIWFLSCNIYPLIYIAFQAELLVGPLHHCTKAMFLNLKQPKWFQSLSLLLLVQREFLFILKVNGVCDFLGVPIEFAIQLLSFKKKFICCVNVTVHIHSTTYSFYFKLKMLTSRTPWYRSITIF